MIELAQNAAGAAAHAGTPGRVLYEFRDNTLVVTNTGVPLNSEGFESLATLRASAKWRHVIRAVLNEPDRSVELLVDAVSD